MDLLQNKIVPKYQKYIFKNNFPWQPGHIEGVQMKWRNIFFKASN